MKRIYSILLALCVSSMLLAQLSIWNGSSDIWTKGAGTEASPYLIESAEQLAFISDMVNGGVTTYENTYFKLMTNIDLGQSAWIPISFCGIIDGNNHTIIYSGDQPLFGNYSKGIIKRLNVECTNGFAISIEGASIIDCTYKGKNTMIGSAKSANFMNCECIVEIPDSIQKGNYTAGMVNVATSCKFIACKALGSISVSSWRNSSITNYYIYNSEYRLGACNIFAGGLVAYSNGCQYNRCAWNGNVTTSGCDGCGVTLNDYWMDLDTYNFSGGIIGLSVKDSIRSCLTLGNIKANKPYVSWGGSAGIIGIQSNNEKNITSISNSFTSDSSCFHQSYNGYYARIDKILSGGKQWGTSYGTTGTPLISNCYSRKDKTEASMKSASFPIILNTDSTVFIQDKFGVNDGYPIYKEQVYAITNPATDIQLTSANLNASYYALNADSIGFEYKESADKTHWYKRVTIDTLSSDSSYKLENLATGTEYTYRFWVAQNGVFYFGEELTFTTQECSTNTYPETATICNGEEYEFANKILTKSGVYYDTLTAVNGCDSIIELTLTVSPVNEIQKYDTIDAGESYDFFGNILTETGTYKHYVPAGAYCNLVIMNLYVKQPSVVVSVQSSNPSLGTVIGGGTYEKYTPVTLTAIPNQGCRFVQWTDSNTDNPRVIIPESDCTYIADFEEVSYTLTLAANDVAMGNVFGAGTYKYGTEVAINAIPNTGYQFTQWSDNDTNASRTITITSDLSLTAYFQPIKYTIIATANDETLGTVYGSGEYAYNTSVSLMAVPQNGCEFITWSNGVNSNPYTFVAVDNVTLQAIFHATSSGVEDVDVDANTSIQKILRNGQLLIIRDGKTYNVMGQGI